jgi:hypothetical protein
METKVGFEKRRKLRFVCTLDRAGCVGMAALDCEMVSTAVGFELGRVSLVGQNSEVSACFF